MADLADGESTEMQGSGKKPYVLKNTGGVFSCSCPAWRNQSVPIESRTCKHLRRLRGDAAETERVGSALPAQREGKAAKEGPPLLLAHRWESDVDLTGWWLSEKLDGVRAWWDGKRFLSRQGNEFHAPDWFVAGLPETPLDGELWTGRGAFQRTVSVVRRQDRSDHWKSIRYMVFDAPALDEPFERRLEHVADFARQCPSEHVVAHEHVRCEGLDRLRERLAEVEALGGEGLMLRQPESRYEAGRSTTLLKVKTFHDAEAVVVDHVKGKGRHKGRLGAVMAKLPDGTLFSVGTGFADRQREDPPPVGSTITFRYQELSDGGVPRFPSFVRLHEDSPAPPPAGNPKSESPTPKPKESVMAAEPKYYEYEDEKSSKFWEVSREDNRVTVRYGRIGAKGQTKAKEHADAAAATAAMEKLIDEKTGKGYKPADRPAE